MRFQAKRYSPHQTEMLNYCSAILVNFVQDVCGIHYTYRPKCSAVPAPEKSIEPFLPVHQDLCQDLNL